MLFITASFICFLLDRAKAVVSVDSLHRAHLWFCMDTAHSSSGVNAEVVCSVDRCICGDRKMEASLQPACFCANLSKIQSGEDAHSQRTGHGVVDPDMY